MSQDTIKKSLEVEDKFSATFDKFNGKLKDTEQQSSKTEKSFGGISAAAVKMASAIGISSISTYKLVGALSDCVKEAQDAELAQNRLATMARGVAKATESQVTQLKALATAYSKVTSIGDDATVMGQSQLVTMGMGATSAAKLTKSMLDLAAAQYGSKVSGEQMVDVANMLGKAYQGQVGALTRAGVVVDETTKKIIENGTEAERTAALVKIVNDNYGGLAESIAKTDAGKIEQMRNAFGELKEDIGNSILPYLGQMASLTTDIIDKIRGGQSNADSFAALSTEQKIASLKKTLSSFGKATSSEMASYLAGIKREIATYEKQLLEESTSEKDRANAILAEKEKAASIDRAKKSAEAYRKQLQEEAKHNLDMQIEFANATADYMDEIDRVAKENEKKRRKDSEDTYAKEKQEAQEYADWLVEMDNFVSSNRDAIDEKERKRRIDALNSIQASTTQIMTAFSSISASRQQVIMAQYDAEKERVEESTMSAKSKEAAMKKIDKERAKAEKEAQKRAAQWALLQAAINVPLAIGSGALAVLGAMKDQTGGALARIVAGAAAGAAAAGSIAAVVTSANQLKAVSGAREFGGMVRSGGMYEVGERGRPEVLTSGGRNYLLAGNNSGTVTPIQNFNGLGSTTTNHIYITESGNANVTADAVFAALERADRNGTADWGRLKNLAKAVK